VTILGLREPEPEPSMSGIRTNSVSKCTRTTEGSVASVCTSVIVVVGVAVEVEIEVAAEIDVVDARVEVEPAMARDTWDFAGVLLSEPVLSRRRHRGRGICARGAGHRRRRRGGHSCSLQSTTMKEEEGSMQNGTIYVTRFFHQPISGLGRYTLLF
jgi:hypothetical protein